MNRRLTLTALAAFLLTASAAVERGPARSTVVLVPAARAQSMACFTRCAGDAAQCRTTCRDSRVECGSSGFGPEACDASLTACDRRCGDSRASCERSCL